MVFVLVCVGPGRKSIRQAFLDCGSNCFCVMFPVQSEHAVSEAGEPAPSGAQGEEEEQKEEVTLVSSRNDVW